MSLLFICNTSSDSISKIDLEEFSEVSRINLRQSNMKRVGPHGVCKYKNNIITANSFSNTLSIINIEGRTSVSHKFIGMHCNDVVVLNGLAYITCGDLNCVAVFDLKSMDVAEIIPCGSQPHSISLNKKKSILIVSNLDNDSITLIDTLKRTQLSIKVGPYPTKAIFTLDGSNIIVCESNMGSDCTGFISIISLNTLTVLSRASVGVFPADMCCDDRYIYVSNFLEGTISVLDMATFKEVKKIVIGGMPRGIVSLGRNLYIGDNLNNILINVNYESCIKSKMPIGCEPTGMVLI